MMSSESVFRVLLADEIAPEGVAILEEAAELEVAERGGIDAEELRSIIADYDALIVRSRTRVTADILQAADRLKVIGRAGVGVDNIDLEVATRRGVVVLNAPGGNVVSAAELTFALMLALVRHLARADATLRSGVWERGRFKGIELYGKTLGLVGAGRIGSEVAKRARAFGMRVIAYDPYLSRERAERMGIQLVTLPDLLEESDVVSIHTPLTDETTGMIGARELAMLKPTAYLINAARGGVVDEDALAQSLSEGRLAGAALDVFAREPVPAGHPLLELDNVLVVPHLGAATREAQTGVGIEICAAVRDALLTGDFRSAVNAPELAGQRNGDLVPLLDLTNRLGRVLGGLARGSYRKLEVRFAGHEEALRAVSAAAAQGLLCEVVEGPLTLVNSLHLASERGLSVSRMWLGAAGAGGEYVELRLEGADGALRVAGVLLGSKHARIARIGEYRMDLQPRGTILVLRNRDVPGVIGRVGSVLGEAGVNIAEYHQARREAGGEAMAAIAVDGVVGRDVIDRLAVMEDVVGVWQIQLPDAMTGTASAEVDVQVGVAKPR